MWRVLAVFAFLTACSDSGGKVIQDCPDCPEMVILLPGAFQMGEDSHPKEAPRHEVVIPTPFAIGKYEVTQAEWQAVMGSNPSSSGLADRRRPVDTVSWDDAQAFIQALNAKTGKTYRLPTEAEWEYAARAGTHTAYSFGDDPALLDKYGWYAVNSEFEPSPVGQLKPNPFGLFDMHGNVWEWVADCHTDGYVGAPANGSARQGEPGCRRVLRGGAIGNEPKDLRSATRYGDTPDYRVSVIGLRLVREVP